MTVRLTHTSHGHAPQSSGLQVDDAGNAVAWKDYGHRVGRFARELSGSERAALESALATAAAGDVGVAAPAGPLLPSGATEQLTADGLPDVVLQPHAEPPAGLGDVVDLLHHLRDELTESPVAALELDVSGSPLRARLRHVGSEPLTVRLGTLTLQATLFGPDSALLDSATVTVDVGGAAGEIGEVGPGWSLPLTEDLAMPAPAKGGFLSVTVGTPEVDVWDNGVLHGVELSWMAE
jgi:hypothetical protein